MSLHRRVHTRSAADAPQFHLLLQMQSLTIPMQHSVAEADKSCVQHGSAGWYALCGAAPAAASQWPDYSAAQLEGRLRDKAACHTLCNIFSNCCSEVFATLLLLLKAILRSSSSVWHAALCYSQSSCEHHQKKLLYQWCQKQNCRHSHQVDLVFDFLRLLDSLCGHVWPGCMTIRPWLVHVSTSRGATALHNTTPHHTHI
jgi:hypothetical protein